jgi:hypothetical protein
MTITRQLQQNRIDFVRISASNPLDQIFLASFLHRAYPDAQLDLGSDILMARDIDNVPFIGSISIGPYTLMGIGRSDPTARTYTDSSSAATYNAARYTFWQATAPQKGAPEPGCPDVPGPTSSTFVPRLCFKGYVPLMGDGTWQPIEWATVIGRDGYYPLGILDFDVSEVPGFLPRIDRLGNLYPPERISRKPDKLAERFLLNLKHTHLYPSLAWTVLSWLIVLLCFGHAVLVLAAHYWSLLHRDLAICDNDQPPRRSMYIHVATAAICLMAFIVSCPMLGLSRRFQTDFWGQFTSWVLLASGAAAAAATVLKTWGNAGWSNALIDSHLSGPMQRA